MEIGDILPFESDLHQWLLDNRAELIDRIEKASKWDDAIAGELKSAIGDFKNDWTKDRAAA
jgi:F0F1-type ATP synthase alpha subunit